MRILITNITLGGRSGTETATRDIVLGLLTCGHEVMVYSPVLGEIAAELSAAGATVEDDVRKFTRVPHIIHGHHHVETVQALLRFPHTPAIFVLHDVKAWHDVPPITPQIRRYVTVSTFGKERLERYGISPEIIRLVFNSFDPKCFVQRNHLNPKPQNALLFSSTASAFHYVGAVEEACGKMDIPLSLIGDGVGRQVNSPGELLPRYDLVFGLGRCAIESMATGAAVILCGPTGLGPMITKENVAALREGNFGQFLLASPHDSELIVAEIEKYDEADAVAVSRYIWEHATLSVAIENYQALYREVLTEDFAMADSLVAVLQKSAQCAANFERMALEKKPSVPLPEEISTQVTLKILRCPSQVTDVFLVEVELVNQSDYVLGSRPPYPVRFCYHWFTPQGDLVQFDGRRTDFSHDLPSGEKGRRRVVVEPPPSFGQYLLRITLVQESVMWFDSLAVPVMAEAEIDYAGTPFAIALTP